MAIKRGQQENLTLSSGERIFRILLFIYGVAVLAALAIFCKMLWLKISWEPGDRVLSDPFFTLQTTEKTLKPERGDILDCNGKILATSTPKYNIYMDCTVRKAAYATDKTIDKKTGVKNGIIAERNWQANAVALANLLPSVLPGEGKDANYYKNLILKGRASGNRYAPIAKDIDHDTLLKLKQLPLFKESKNVGGMIVEMRDTRQYPYDMLARRVIGYVKNNDAGSSKSIGIEGSFDWALHGEPGSITMKRTEDGHGKIANIADPDSKYVPAKNGSDIVLSIDIDIQDIADRALRRQVEHDEKIADACMIVMEVKTGAIRAMVNLHRGKNGEMNETENLAVFRTSEPGSVFKTVGLMTMLEDRKVRLETEVPTDGGKYGLYPLDGHLRDFERNKKRKRITVREGLEISSNNVFARLATEHYGKNPAEFIDRIYEYKLGEAYDFDLKGMGKPIISDPRKSGWSGTSLGSVAYGYGVSVTPLHTVTFYNAIANGGKMMKPYLVECINREDGKVQKRGQAILNGSICSPKTADSLKSALRSVVTDGTARKLKAAKCTVAGKTGTARITLSQSELRGNRNPYQDIDGAFRNQGSFVGFFPAENPQYTAIVVVYSTLSRTSYYGAQSPAGAFMEVVDCLYGMEGYWRGEYSKRRALPPAETINIVPQEEDMQIVPDVKGFGLSDAVYSIENNGYECEFSGVGKVVSQSPKAGSKLAKGGKITVRLE